MIPLSEYTHHTLGGLWLDRALDDRASWSVDEHRNLVWRNGAAVVAIDDSTGYRGGCRTRLVSHSPSIPSDWCYGDALVLTRRCVELRRELER